MATASRAPLGRVSNARLNIQAGSPAAAPAVKGGARMSLGPGMSMPRYSLGAVLLTAKKSKQQRMSMMPTSTAAASSNGGGRDSMSGNRRQSTMSNTRRRQSTATVGGVIQGGNDPRPIGDKTFMRQSIENLIQFLVDHNYDQAISPKVLHRPTGKDFENVMLFLFGLVDPCRAKNGEVKFADEVTTMYKGLRYPFNISKTALAAVGSPHTWPALLASLTWLVELLEYDERAGLQCQEYESMSPEDMDSDKQFFVYLRRAYAFFLAGDDESQERLDAEREGLVLEEQVSVRKACDRARATKEQVERQLAEEQSTPSRVPELEQRKRDFQSDRLKWDKLLRQFEENRDVMLVKVGERQKECREKEEELAKLQQAKEEVAHTLEQQELSPADVERITQEKRHLEEAINRATEQREEIQRRIWALEMQASKRLANSEQLLEQYNSVAKALRLGPGGSGASVLLRLDPAARQVVGAENSQPASGVRQALEQLVTMSKQKVHEVRTESMELRNQAEQNEEEQQGVRREIDALQARVRIADETHDEEKRLMDEELARRAVETEAVEEEIHHLKASVAALQQPALEAQLRVEQLRAQLDRELSAQSDALAQVDEELSAAMESCCAFQEYVTNSIAELERDLKSRATRAGELAVERLADLRSLAESK